MSEHKEKAACTMAIGGMLAYALAVIAMAVFVRTDLAFAVPISFFVGGMFAGLCALFISFPEEWSSWALVSGTGSLAFSLLAMSAIFA